MSRTTTYLISIGAALAAFIIYAAAGSSHTAGEPMSRIRADYVFGTTTNDPLLVGDTSLSSPGLANLPAVSGGDVAAVTLYDGTSYEIVHVTAHTAAATTATVLRAQEGSTAQEWPAGTTWHLSPTALDFTADATADWISVTDYGATGDGTTDDTTSIQAALDAAAAGETVYIPTGRYKLTAALTVSKHITIRGAGVMPTWGAIGTDFNSINAPIASPYFVGSVLVQTTAATNGLNLSGAGKTMHLSGFGIEFEGAHKFTNTGHGIRYSPPTHGTGLDNGLSGSRWENLAVFGHDGDHYAFDVTNGIYNQYDHLQSFGGGLFYLGQNSGVDGHYGNSLFNSIYGQVFCEGTAHGIRLVNTAGLLNMLQFNRAQVTVSDMTSTFTGATAPTSAQQMFYADDVVTRLTLIQADFETNVGSDYTMPGTGVWYMDPASYTPTSGGGGTSTTSSAHVIKTAGNYTINSTSWTNLDTTLDLTVPAVSGDVIEVSLAAYVAPNASTQWAMLDAATVVGGSAVTAFSSGTGTPAGNGVPAWSIAGSRGEGPIGGSVMLTVGAGDVSGGNVTIRLRYKTANAVSHTVRASSGDPLHFSVKNLGQ